MKTNSEVVFSNAVVIWDGRHAKILQDFLLKLDAENVKYVILKNAKGLPFENNAKDIDIVIEPKKYKLTAQILENTYRNNGITHVKVHKFERLRCWYGINCETKLAIHIDLLEGFLHKGFELFPFEMLYENSDVNNNGVRVLNPFFESIVLLLHSTICYKSIKEKYAKLIDEAYQIYKSDYESVLAKIFGNRVSSEILELLDKKDYRRIASLGKHFSRVSKRRLLLKRPLFSIFNFLDFFWEKVCRIIFNFEKYNAFITCHAPDGTGKTTFIEHLGNELGFMFVCNAKDLISLHHFRPCILPNLGAVGEKAGVMKQDKNFTVPHRAKPAGKLSSLIRMTYYWLDYVIGMPIIMRKSAQFDHITIFDRYIYDFLVDPLRARISLPYWVRKMFAKMVKRPKIVFVLETDAETILSRKQELTKDEIERQLSEFRKLENLGINVHYLDASKKPDEMAMDAVKIVLDTFSNKL